MKKDKLPNELTWWNIVSDKSIDLAIAQSETLLKETVSTAQSIQDKSDKLTALFVPIISGLLIFIITYKGSYSDVLWTAAVFFALDLLLVLYFLFGNLVPYKINVPGSDAISFLNDAVIKYGDEEHQVKKIGFMICNDNKKRTDYNEIANQLRSTRIVKGLFTLVIGLPLCPILGYLLHLLCENYF